MSDNNGPKDNRPKGPKGSRRPKDNRPPKKPGKGLAWLVVGLGFLAGFALMTYGMWQAVS